ncbi:hypothetical protein Hanom_Chr14g01301481 [Helianthus anomalus]
MAMFCDFFGSKTLFSFTTGGRTDLRVSSFFTGPPELHPKRDSIMSSFNLHIKGIIIHIILISSNKNVVLLVVCMCVYLLKRARF